MEAQQPIKVYEVRESLLTDVLKTKHGAAVYNVVLLLVLCGFSYCAVSDWRSGRSFQVGFELILTTWEDVPLVFGMWCAMLLSVSAIYPVFRFWAVVQQYCRDTGWPSIAWNLLFLAFLGVFIFIYTFLPLYIIFVADIGVAGGAALSMQQIITYSKLYSFFRTVVPRVLSCKMHDHMCDCRSTFSSFLYFLLLPFMIFKDKYPRTPTFRLSFYTRCICESIVCVLLLNFILERWWTPSLRDFTSFRTRPWQFVMAVLSGSLPTLAFMLILFYGVFHALLNAMCEALRFGDRLTYKDWWNSGSFQHFYRTWNVPMQDWLYFCVYRDFYKFIAPSRKYSMLAVFLASGLAHDFITVSMYKFYYPTFFVSITIGATLTLVIPGFSMSPRLDNFSFWFCLVFVSSILFLLPMAEYYSRKNCPQTIDSPILDFLVPRSWTCTVP